MGFDGMKVGREGKKGNRGRRRYSLGGVRENNLMGMVEEEDRGITKRLGL